MLIPFSLVLFRFQKYDIILATLQIEKRDSSVRRNYLKDLKWHIFMTIISIFFICKYSSAPPIFDALNIIFQRPEENTLMYELIRIAENVSLAYIASLVFYLLVDYIPLIKEENNTLHLLEKYLCPLYMYMDKVNSYFRYATGISNIQAATNEEVKTIDDFSFKNSAEFLMIKSIRDGKDDGEYVDAFEAKKSIVFCGQKIMECIHNIDYILNGNKMPRDFIILINQIRSCSLLETIIKVMPSSDLIVNGQPVAQTYVSFYKGLAEFVALEEKLGKYNFLKLRTVYREATINEIQEWKDYQIKIRKEHPEIDQIYAQLNNNCELGKD